MVKAAKKNRIFVIASDLPGDFGGAPIRNFQLTKELAKLPNTEVELFCLTTRSNIPTIKRELESSLSITAHILPKVPSSPWINIRSIVIHHMQPFMLEFRLSGLGKIVREISEKRMPTIIQIEQIDAYYSLLPYLAWFRSQGVQIVLDAHNIELNAFKGAISSFPTPKKIVGKLLLPAFARLERKAILESDIMLACSEREASFFRDIRNNAPVYLIPNGVDCAEFVPSTKSATPTLIFIGSTNYAANSDAINSFVNNVYPKVKLKQPRTRLLVIGATKQWAIEHGIDEDTSIETLGFVENIKPYLDESLIGLCPIREGSGTRLKVLTYMSASLSVVSTLKGAEGIDYSDGKELIIAKDDDAFANAILSVLGDESKRQVMGRAGRRLVLAKYDWKVIGYKLRDHYKEFMQ